MRANTVVKAQHASYQTDLDAYRNLHIQNIENSLINAWPKNLNCQINDYQHQATAQAFKQVLGIERLQELDSEKEWLTTNFILSAEGKLLEVEFITRVNTLFTADEIEALEIALKNELSFGITWLDDNEADYVSMSAALPLATIIAINQGTTVPEGIKLEQFNTALNLQAPSL